MRTPEQILRESKVVAVYWANPRESAPAFYVPAYLRSVGYDVWPVCPPHAGKALFGRTILSSLAEIPVPVDLVDVFRRSEVLLAELPLILAMRPLPRAVWFQSGIRDDVAALRLAAEGIDVVQDRCTLQDHKWLVR